MPNNTSVTFLKRVVGLPGDKIQIEAGILKINGVPVTRRLIREETDTDGLFTRNAKVYEETLPGGRY